MYYICMLVSYVYGILQWQEYMSCLLKTKMKMIFTSATTTLAKNLACTQVHINDISRYKNMSVRNI